MSRLAALSLVAAAAAAPAHARQTYLGYIPSAPVSGRCATCHVDSMGGGARNAFGADAEATLSGDGPAWSKLFCRDSDGDGRTNGEELGDPCGTWTPGEAPLRTEPLSAPGDADDAVTIDDSAACNGAAPPVCDSAVSAVGCAQAPGAALIFALAGALALKRRRAVR